MSYLKNNISDFDLFFPQSPFHKDLKTVKYSEIKNQLETGDVILVDGIYSYSRVIDILQRNRWGHGAMVIRSRDIDPDNKLGLPDPLLWESNVNVPKSTPNLWGQNNLIKEGPMLISLEERLKHTRCNFNGVVMAYKKLKVDRSQIRFSDLTNYFDAVIDKLFSKNNLSIVISVLTGKFIINCGNSTFSETTKVEIDLNLGHFVKSDINTRKFFNESLEINADFSKDSNRMYCTELMADTYIFLKLLDKCPVSYSYIPKDFSDAGAINFLNNAHLEKEIYFDILN